MAEPSAPNPPPTPVQASSGEVLVPESWAERSKVNAQHTQAVFAAHAAKDHALQELCELQQHQFLLTCQIQDLERAGASDPLLPDLRTSLANVTAALQQRQPLEPSAGQGSRH